MNIAPAVPGIFTANGSGSGQAAAYNSDGRTLNSSATPAAQGSTIILYGTGEGQTSPGGVDGKLATASLPTPMLPVSVMPVSVTIGGVPAGVQYAGAAYGEVAGMLQINVVVPSTVSGSALPVIVQVGNTMSQAGVTIAVAPPAFAITSQEIVG
jgi:trimeric autotransporter adhesin